MQWGQGWGSTMLLECLNRIFFLFSATRGPPDISSLVPLGPKYTMKWSAPLMQVHVVEVGKDALFQQGGVKRSGSFPAPGKLNLILIGPPWALVVALTAC